MRGVPVRVIVDSSYNAARPENFRRRVSLVATTDGGATWQQVGRWITLPGQAFFSPELSKPNGQITIPGLPGGSASAIYAYYEFNPAGQASAPGQFVLANGSVVNGSFVERSQENRSGFYIHRLGKPVFFADASSIPQP